MAEVAKLTVSIYVAGPWIHRETAKEYAQRFREAGVKVNSRWHDIHQDTDDPAILKQEASNDLEDILNSDGLVVIQSAQSEGKAFEQGFCIAASQFTGIRNKVLVIREGERQYGNIFQRLDEVYDFVNTIEEAVEKVKTWQPANRITDELVQQAFAEAMLQDDGGPNVIN